MNKRHDITAQTKQNLIDAFWQLYCMRPISQITVRDVVQRAGYNRSTFYEYFRDVHAVLEAIEVSIIPTLDTLPPFDGPGGTIGMPVAQFWECMRAMHATMRCSWVNVVIRRLLSNSNGK